MTFFFFPPCFTFICAFKPTYLGLTTKFCLEGGGQCFNLTEISNQKYVLFMRFTPNGLQRVHVHSSHSNGKNQDSWVASFRSNLCHWILRSPICHYHDNARHVLAQRSSPFRLWKRDVDGVLNSQPSHGASRQVHHSPDCSLNLLLPPERLQRELMFDSAAVLNQAHSGGIGTDVQELQDG